MNTTTPGDTGRGAGFVVATEDAAALAEQAVALVERARGAAWYDEEGGDADAAALALCLLRRACAGKGGGPVAGDEAVRAALSQASPESLVWIASRAVSYLDESGFAEAVEPYVRGRPA